MSCKVNVEASYEVRPWSIGIFKLEFHQRGRELEGVDSPKLPQNLNLVNQTVSTPTEPVAQHAPSGSRDMQAQAWPWG